MSQLQIAHKLVASLSLVFLVAFLMLIVSTFVTLLTSSLQLAVTKTPSVSPVVKPSDGLIIRPVTVHNLQLGQIIDYRARDGGDMNATGLLVNFNARNEQLRLQTTSGQNNSSLISLSQVNGAVVAIIPHAGQFLSYLRQPIHLFLALYLPALLLIYYQVRSLIGHSTKHLYRYPGY